jgi:hypothetical protein
MTVPIQCATCRHFQPDASNPDVAMGRCMHSARHGYWFALERHRCADHEAKPETATSE